MAMATAVRPWERMPRESPPAYAAFLCYRGLGTGRSFVATARALGRHESLIRRWATRYRWRERAWEWDVHLGRQDEAALWQQRESRLRERLEDLDRMGRACLALFRTLVRRDPETGEVSFDQRFTPQVALRFLELALRAQGAFDRPPAEDRADEATSADLFGLADSELAELIELARERADQEGPRKGKGNESDKSRTQQDRKEDSREEGEDGWR